MADADTIKKIFELGTPQWESGIAEHAHDNRGGIWHKALGINPFVDPTQQSTQVGLLQTASAPSDITASVVTDTILAGVNRPTGAAAGTFYMVGTDKIYTIDISGNNNPVKLLDRTNGASAIDIFQPRGGNPALYYWQKTQIGQYGPNLDSTPSATDGHFTGLQSTEFHPRKKFRDEIFYGNLDRIGKIFDNAGTTSHNANVLDFPSDYMCTCLEEDGNYLVIGITKNKGASGAAGDNIIYGDTKVLFWDRNGTTATGSTWNKEWSIPDVNIIALKRIRNTIYALCGRGLYEFNFDNRPKKVKTLNTREVPLYGRSEAITRIGDAIVWSGGAPSIHTYGKLTPQSPVAYHELYAGLTGTPTFLDAETRFMQLFAATPTPKLFRYDLTSGGNTSISPETIYIPLKDKYKISRIELIFGEPLVSGDSLNIDLQGDEDVSASDWGTASFAVHGAVRTVALQDNNFEAENLKMIFNFTAGNVKIKRLSVWGEKVEF